MAIAWLAISRLLTNRVPVDLNQRLLANAAGCELARTIHVCDVEGSIHADANAPRNDECNLVLPGNA